MSLSKTKYFVYGILMSVLLVAAIAQAATSNPNGVFGKYFENMTLACDYDTDVITGHMTSGTDFGKRICTSFKTLLGRYYKTLAPAPADKALVGFDDSGDPEYISVITTNVLDSKLGTLCTSIGGLWNSTLGTCNGVGGGSCVPDGSCSATTPACNTTTTGVNSCGGSCTKTGGSCACVPNGSCSAATPACNTTTTGVNNCGGSCTKTGGSCACVPDGSCTAATPACEKTTTGVDKCGGACIKTGGTCSCTPDGSCSAATPACEKTTTGVDKCGGSCTKTGTACLPTVKCAGGSLAIDSPDGTNKCYALWGDAPIGGNAPAFMITNIGGGILEGTCNTDGVWNYSYKCPNKTVASCTGGGVTLSSPDKTNTCRYDWPNVSAGTSKSVTGTNGGTLNGTCSAAGSWDYSYNCPNKVVPTCTAGGVTLSSPDGTNSCRYDWPNVSAGVSANVVGSNGGTLNGSCSTAGAWNYSYNCPNKVTPACPGGGTSLSSSDGSNTCTYTWSNVSAGTIKSFGGTSGGTLNGSCSAAGAWSYSYTCPNKVTKSCSAGSTSWPSATGKASCILSWSLTTAGNSASFNGTNGGKVSAFCDASGTWQSVTATCP